jgi:hypothetical protein
MSAKVTFVQKRAVAESAQSSRVTVPKSAIQTRDGKTVVLVMNGDTVSLQTVTIGSELGDRVEIRAGLAGGETVVIRGGDGLNDGSRVKTHTDR